MANFLESKNPIINESKFQTIGAYSGEVTTVNGAITKSINLFGIMMVTAVFSFWTGNPLLMMIGAIGGLIAVLVATFKPTTSPISAPIYAALEGLFVGSVSAMYAAQFQGIVLNAAVLTMGTLFLMLMLYKFQIIKVTEKLRSGIIIATGAVAITYIMAMVFRLFGFDIPYIHEGGMLGIGFSVVVVGIAALNLLLDFDNFEKAESMGAPKYMEWYLGMSLLVTIVWLYIEFLRLLSKLSRD